MRKVWSIAAAALAAAILTACGDPGPPPTPFLMESTAVFTDGGRTSSETLTVRCEVEARQEGPRVAHYLVRTGPAHALVRADGSLLRLQDAGSCDRLRYAAAGEARTVERLLEAYLFDSFSAPTRLRSLREAALTGPAADPGLRSLTVRRAPEGAALSTPRPELARLTEALGPDNGGGDFRRTDVFLTNREPSPACRAAIGREARGPTWLPESAVCHTPVVCPDGGRSCRLEFEPVGYEMDAAGRRLTIRRDRPAEPGVYVRESVLHAAQEAAGVVTPPGQYANPLEVCLGDLCASRRGYEYLLWLPEERRILAVRTHGVAGL